MKLLMIFVVVVVLSMATLGAAESLSMEHRAFVGSVLDDEMAHVASAWGTIHANLARRSGVTPVAEQAPGKLVADIDLMESLRGENEMDSMIEIMAHSLHSYQLWELKHRTTTSSQEEQPQEPFTSFFEETTQHKAQLEEPAVVPHVGTGKTSLAAHQTPHLRPEQESACQMCKRVALTRERKWSEACASECSAVPSTVTPKSLEAQVSKFFHASPKCPKIDWSWGCVHAFLPHLTILGVSANYNALLGGAEVVTDFQSFHTGFFVYGGLSIGTDLAGLFGGVAAYAGMGYKGKDSTKSLEEFYSEHFLSVSAGG